MYLFKKIEGDISGKAIIDLETGEIIATEGENIVIKAIKFTSCNSYRRIKQYEKSVIEEIKERKFNKIYEEGLENLNLDNKERGLFLFLTQYLPYGNDCLRYKNGKKITTDTLVSKSGLSKPTFLKIIKSLEKKNYIRTMLNNGKTRYYINPSIVSRGSRPLEFVEELFNSGRQ